VPGKTDNKLFAIYHEIGYGASMENSKTHFNVSNQVFIDKNLVQSLTSALNANSRRQINSLLRELPTRLADSDNARFQAYCSDLFLAVMPALYESKPATRILFMENMIRIQRDPASKLDVTRVLVNMLGNPEMATIPDQVAGIALLSTRTALASRDQALANKSIEIWTHSVTGMFNQGLAIDAKRIIREASACTQLAFYQPMQDAVEQMKQLSLDMLFKRGLNKSRVESTQAQTETPQNLNELRARLFPNWTPQ
jgi:hypothetical protein